MARITVHSDIELDSPALVEGLPGLGLVGKIAADHLVSSLDMEYYGAVRCNGLPQVTVYRADSSELMPPVRLYATEDGSLVVLQSDIPVSPQTTEGFAECVTDWVVSNDVTPLYVTGLPSEKDADVPDLYGVATGDGLSLLDEAGIVPPPEGGLVSGPTGALLAEASDQGVTSVGLIAEASKQFPDPEAARSVLEYGVEPLADVEVDTDDLVDQAEDIREARERLAERMQQAEGDESSQAQPLRMFQ
ncbi:proteasome assembly chaperone family protein [Halomarina oriensis]|uniref:Proteasome assembly chaperone family protein n=1 Tax=Halomarina oriensis TaxID=671145 RepID=A0A6B0GV59_9EURY|nr:proteasome assembly chaperone family protein [Halomarina oriensis]MWG35618.1 proteasome assembly chaperone family protein [Halomarina oriensis]